MSEGAAGMFWGTDSMGGGLQPFQRVSGQEVHRRGAPVPDASAFGPRKSKANDYVPARFRLQEDGSIDTLLTRPVPMHALGALSEGFGEEARRGRERQVEEAVIAADPSLADGSLGALPLELSTRLSASLALASRAAASAAEAALAANAVGLRGTSLYASIAARDPITSALTVPTSPSAGYYAVMRMLCALVRSQLVPDATGVPSGGGGAPILAAPALDKLGPAFPELVRAEDPAYFEALEKGQKELAFTKSEHMEGLRKAYAAIGEDLRYCFDRRAAPPSPPRRAPTARQPSQDADSSSSSSSALTEQGSSPAPRHGPRRLELKETVMRSGRTVLEYGNASTGALHPALALRREQGKGFLVTAGEATGNLACAVPSSSAHIANASSRNPLRADAMADTLRWSLMQRVVMEQRRARCAHIISLLAREMEAEAGRQARLRRAAGKFAVAASRAAGEDWTQYACLLGTAEEVAEEEAGVAAAARAAAAAGPSRSERYLPKRDAAFGGASSGAFSAQDLASTRFAIAIERAEASDSIVRILEAYALIPASSVAIYLETSLRDTEGMARECFRPQAAAAARAAAEEAECSEVVEIGGESFAVSPSTAKRIKQARAVDALRDMQPIAYESAFSLPPPLPPPPGQVINGQLAPQGVPPRTLVPPSDYFIAHGAARPYRELDEAQEDAFNANAAGGLSTFNLRPFAGRGLVRAAVVHGYPDLDGGYKDSAEELAAAAAVEAEEAAIAKAALEAGAALLEEEAEAQAQAQAQAEAEAEAEAGAAGGGEGGAGAAGGAASPTPSATAAAAASASRRAPGGSGLKAVAAIRKVYPPPRKGVPEWLRAIRPAARPAGEEEKEGKGSGGPVKLTSFDSSNFAESDAVLRQWVLGGRPLWEELALSEKDVSQVRESTDMQLNIVSRMRKEPPSRFSHLLGRYMPVETFRVQRAYEAALSNRPKKNNVHSMLKSSARSGEGGDT